MREHGDFSSQPRSVASLERPVTLDGIPMPPGPCRWHPTLSPPSPCTLITCFSTCGALNYGAVLFSITLMTAHRRLWGSGKLCLFQHSQYLFEAHERSVSCWPAR